VISASKLAAARANGRRSKGPKTAYGKTTARHNARRHGLSVISRYNPAYSYEIEQMAKAICSPNVDPALFQQALIIAECQLVLNFVQHERVALIEQFRDPFVTRNDLVGARLLVKQMDAAEPEFSYLQDIVIARGEWARPFMAGVMKLKPGEVPEKYVPPRERDESEMMAAAMPDLQRLLRYERRALSRLKRATTIFAALRLTRHLNARRRAVFA
jgi:hypothetical protein